MPDNRTQRAAEEQMMRRPSTQPLYALAARLQLPQSESSLAAERMAFRVVALVAEAASQARSIESFAERVASAVADGRGPGPWSNGVTAESALEAALARRAAGLRGNPLVGAIESVREQVAAADESRRQQNIAVAILPPLSPPGGQSGNLTLAQRMAIRNANLAEFQRLDAVDQAARTEASRASAQQRAMSSRTETDPQRIDWLARDAGQRAYSIYMQFRGFELVRDASGVYRPVMQHPVTGRPLGPGSSIPQEALRPGEQIVPVPEGMFDPAFPPPTPSALPFGSPIDPGSPGGFFGGLFGDLSIQAQYPQPNQQNNSSGGSVVH